MVESEELIVKTAKAVKKAGASFLRGGAFKTFELSLQKQKNIMRQG